jgi:hypothetical protein
MGKLSANTRKAMASSEFGLPGSRKYPMPDKSHAANAKARATQAVKVGRMSESTKAKIDAKADVKLGENKPPRHKHKGALGDVMRKAHNTQRMEVVRAHKET